MKKSTRRSFVTGAGTALAVSLAQPSEGTIANETGGFKLGITTWSLKSFARSLAIEMIRQMHTPYVSVKEFHLPYRSTPEELAAGRREFEKAGLQIVGGGVINLHENNETDIRKYFNYAKTCGMPMIACSPTHENLKLLEAMVQEFDIKAAIHNHGAMDKNFPSPDSILKAVHNLDSRVGMCMDIGHAAAIGVDIVQALADAGPRLLDMHIKDAKVASAENSGCDVGEGVLPIVPILPQLQKMKFQGCVNLEYEFDYDAPLTGILKSFAYLRGALTALNS